MTDKGYRTVYLVAAGEYSGYSVWCVFERREDAEAYCEAYLAAAKASDKYLFNMEPFVEKTELWSVVPHVRAHATGTGYTELNDVDPVSGEVVE